MPALCSLDLQVDNGVMLSVEKACLMEPVMKWLENIYGEKGIEVTRTELRNIASLQLELSAVDLMEICSPHCLSQGLSNLVYVPALF